MKLDSMVSLVETMPNEIKNSAYVINLDEYHDIGTHRVVLYVNNKTVTYFNSFGIEYNKTVTYFNSFGIECIPKQIKKFTSDKNIIANIFRRQAYDSVMCGYFCIGFIEFMFNGNSLTDLSFFIK